MKGAPQCFPIPPGLSDHQGLDAPELRRLGETSAPFDEGRDLFRPLALAQLGEDEGLLPSHAA
jgi:hypothetical protein